MQAKKTHKIKVNATFHRLQINKNIKFQTKMQWKRRIFPSIQIKIKAKLDLSITNMATPFTNKTSF